MKRSKKFLALALLVPTLITAACGSAEEQEEAAETGAETTEADDLETIGAGADETAKPDAPEENSGTETIEKPEATDFSFIEGWITSIEEDKTEITLVISHHIKESKSVGFTYQEVLLDGVEAENWEAHGRGADTFTIDPNAFQSFPQTLVLGTNIDNYSELTVHATANFEDGTEPYPFSATFRISEMERKIEEKVVTVTSDEISIEAQELYNADGIVVTVPEQTVSDKDYFLLHIENNTDGTAHFYTDKVTVNGALLKERRNYHTETTAPGESIDMYVGFEYSEGEYEKKMQPDVKSGEISFTFGDQGSEEEVLLTLKYTRND